MVLPARVICRSPEVPFDERKQEVCTRPLTGPPSIALVARWVGRSLPTSNKIRFQRRPRLTTLAAVGTWVMCMYTTHPNATKPSVLRVPPIKTAGAPGGSLIVLYIAYRWRITHGITTPTKDWSPSITQYDSRSRVRHRLVCRWRAPAAARHRRIERHEARSS
jgi:hypothetical protein